MRKNPIKPKPKIPHTKREDLIKQHRDYYYNLFLQNIGKRPKELVDVFELCENSIFRWHKKLLDAGYKLPSLPERDKSYLQKIEKKTIKVKYANTKPINAGKPRKLDDPKPVRIKTFDTIVPEGFTRIVVNGASVITRNPEASRKKYEKHFYENNPLVKFKQKTA